MKRASQRPRNHLTKSPRLLEELAGKEKFAKARKKSLRKFSKGHNNADIRWAVTPKQYALLHTMVYVLTKFQLDQI